MTGAAAGACAATMSEVPPTGNPNPTPIGVRVRVEVRVGFRVRVRVRVRVRIYRVRVRVRIGVGVGVRVGATRCSLVGGATVRRRASPKPAGRRPALRVWDPMPFTLVAYCMRVTVS